MTIETVKMSSKGQIVIPKEIRSMVNADEGSVFAVFSRGESIILKKLETPSEDELFKDLNKMAKESSSHKKGK